MNDSGVGSNEAPTDVRFHLEHIPGARPRGVDVGDLDGDGDADLAFDSGPRASLSTVDVALQGESTVDVTFARGVFREQQPHWGALDDLDGDGDLDVSSSFSGAGRVIVAMNDGAGSLRMRNFAMGGSPVTMGTADLDADGHIDIYSCDVSGAGAIHVMLGDGTGEFVHRGAFSTRAIPYHAVPADFDGDGRPSIVSANFAGTISILRPSDSLLGDPELVRFRTAASTVAAGDFNRDGDLDLAVGHSAASQVTIVLGDGTGALDEAGVFELTTPRHIVVEDMDGDGHLDIVGAGTTRRVAAVAWNDGAGGFPTQSTVPVEATPFTAAAGDVDGDGIADIVTASELSSVVTFIPGRGGREFGVPRNVPVGAGPRWVGIGDMNGDGRADMVSADRAGNSISVLLNQAPPVSDELFSTELCTARDYDRFALASPLGKIDQLAKFVVPARSGDATLLPALVQNTKRHPLHFEFLRDAFPERFGSLSPSEYDRITGRRATRDYYVGSLYRLRGEEGPVYGFNVITSYVADPSELPTPQEVGIVYEALSDLVTFTPVVYFPDERIPREDAETWSDPGFPILIDDPTANLTYQAYTNGEAFGRLKLLTDEEFREANRSGQISFQDILVLETAPRDIEGVVGGVITGVPQAELSHLAIRTARRGTPNAFVREALEAFAEFDGVLVRLEIEEGRYRIRRALPDEVDAWWADRRPSLSEAPTFDAEFDELSSLEEIASLEASGANIESRFGGKASNFARLQTVLDGEFAQYRETAFAVPMRFYLDFLRTNQIPSAIDGRSLSYEEYLSELFASPEFQSDSGVRFERLAALREAMLEQSDVPSALVTRIAVRIAQVFGDTTARVRFRSSSNVEDALEFNGAGLYDSMSACAADDLDVDDRGPSRCDSSRDVERSVGRALRVVWASLWNFRAYEERAFYGIDQRVVTMGILVSRSFPGERANGVAFTGNPQNAADDRYVVTAQQGDVSVVRPDPGILPEKNVLALEFGEVVDIARQLRSTLVPVGDFVLSDEELRELGRLLAHIDGAFPLDLADHDRRQVLLDTEFKIEPDGRLAIKQVRPFLMTEDPPPTPEFVLRVPTDTLHCGASTEFRSPDDSLRLKTTIRWQAGDHTLPTTRGAFRGELFEEILFGLEREPAVSQSPGIFRLRRTPQNRAIEYRFDFEQTFELRDGTSYVLLLSDLRFEAAGDTPAVDTLVVDEEFASESMILVGDVGEPVAYTSCTLERHPLWRIDARLEGGGRIELWERFDPEIASIRTAPAALAEAGVDLGEGARFVDDYWQLVYTSVRHNLDARYEVLLDSPVRDAVSGEMVHRVEVFDPNPAADGGETVTLMGAGGGVIRAPAIAQFLKTPAAQLPTTRFRRGDVLADGDVVLADAVALLRFLFLDGAAPTCSAAADADANGELSITDPIRILNHLFRAGGPLPEPSGECGATVGGLDCRRFPACEG